MAYVIVPLQQEMKQNEWIRWFEQIAQRRCDRTGLAATAGCGNTGTIAGPDPEGVRTGG